METNTIENDTEWCISAPLKRCRLCMADSGPLQLRKLALCPGCTCWCCRCCDHTPADLEPCPCSNIKREVVLTPTFLLLFYWDIRYITIAKESMRITADLAISKHSFKYTHTNMHPLAAFQLQLDGLGGQRSWRAAKRLQIPSSDTVPVEQAAGWEHTLIYW